MAATVRLVGPADSRVLSRTAPEVFDQAIDPVRLAAYLRDPGHLMCVAMDGDLVIGQARAVIHRHPDRSDELYIDNLGVAVDYRRGGVATALIGELVRVGVERGCRDMWLGTEADNAPAIALFRRLGLEPEPMVYFEGRLDTAARRHGDGE